MQVICIKVNARSKKNEEKRACIFFSFLNDKIMFCHLELADNEPSCITSGVSKYLLTLSQIGLICHHLFAVATL